MRLVAVAALVACIAVLCSGVDNPEEYVNTLIGTRSRFDYSTGNTLPQVLRPWGFNGWVPMTNNDGNGWIFHPDDRMFYGIKCTHMPSPWIGDYGHFRVMAALGQVPFDNTWPTSSASGYYGPSRSQYSPYYFNATLIAYGTSTGPTTMEVTSTERAAVIRIRFPPYTPSYPMTAFDQTRNVMVIMPQSSDVVQTSTNGVSGYTTSNSGSTPSNFRMYFVANSSVTPAQVSTEQANGNVVGVLQYDTSVTEVELHLATSLISIPQANYNLASEIMSRGFDDVLKESKKAWRDTLSQVNIKDVGPYNSGDTKDNLLTFYSNLYRATMFPRKAYEISMTTQTPVHYSAYDPNGAVHPGVASTDEGFWDAYRTTYPMLNIFYPQRAGEAIQGWVNAYQEGGWLPKWASPGYRLSMVGTLGDVSLADAIVKNIPGFDQQAAYQAIRKDAFVVPPPGVGQGRAGLSDYIANGYIPSTDGVSEEVSRSMNFYVSDFAIAQAALVLNQTADAAVLLNRSANYVHLFDSSDQFFKSRPPADAPFDAPFDQYAWGGAYTEAGPWQYRFYVPHDVPGLMKLYGGQQQLCSALSAAMTTVPTFHVGGYGFEIHEMTEMVVNCWGQYEHDNQPVHHVLYVMIAAGCLDLGQYWIRQAVTRLYTPLTFSGDEDNGEMAAWYLLSALGLYALAPGTPYYNIGAPLFTTVQVALPHSKTLTISAPNNGPNNFYVAGVTWNGTPISNWTIPYATLMQGGTLAFDMTSSPRGDKY